MVVMRGSNDAVEIDMSIHSLYTSVVQKKTAKRIKIPSSTCSPSF